MKSDCSAESWLNFFSSAGIPMDSSRTYAVTFSKNEIQLDMLSEIKKEYLVDMGITLMGHIIAILRHAKTVYEENVTKTTLSSKPAKSTGTPAVKALPKENSWTKPTLLKSASSNEKEDPKTVNKPVLQVRINNVGSSNLQSSQNKTTNLNICGKEESQPTSNVPKSFVPIESFDSTVGSSKIHRSQNKSASLQHFDRKEIDLLQKSKISSVVINNALKKKSIAENDDVSNAKGRVFERLGVEVPGSLSDSPESSCSNEGVFSRLGGKTPPSWSPSTSPVKAPSNPKANGVKVVSESFFIKKGSNINIPKVKPMMCTMRADEAEAEEEARRGLKRTRSPSPDAVKLAKDDPCYILSRNLKSRLGNLTERSSPRVRSRSVERSISVGEYGKFRSDSIVKSMTFGQNKFDRSDIRKSGATGKPILTKRLSPMKSIALSHGKELSNNVSVNGGIKSRLGHSNLISKTTNQKKVSFGPVSQQYIPIEAKPTYRFGRSFDNDFYANNNGSVNFRGRSRMFNRFGY